MRKPFFRTTKNSWYVWIEGIQRSLGVHGKDNEVEAYKQWQKLLSSDQPEVKAKTRTVKELVEDFLADAADRVKPSSLKFYTRFLVPFAELYGKRKASSVTAREAHAFAFKPSWGNSTRHFALTSLATAFRWAKIPLEGLRIPPKASKGMQAVIPEADASRIIAQARGDMKALLRFLWLTGCRPSEGLSLKADMVDETNSIVVLKNHKTVTQTGKPRFIYLSTEALTLLKEQRQRHGNGFLFRTSGNQPYSLNNAVNILWRLNKKLGTNATLYGFRHSYATEGLARGLPEAHVAELLGHSSTKMLHSNYAHLGAKAEAMKASAQKVRE